MVNLNEFYNKRVNSLNKNDLLKQVGHSVNGIAISQVEFNILINGINDVLNLNNQDNLLDLCCGNGVITREFIQSCDSICGIDFSKELISIAKNINTSNKIKFYNTDVFNVAKYYQKDRLFSKILMFGSLQHFSISEFPKVLNLIQTQSTNDFIALFGFVPDKQYKWKFYNTLKKKALYVSRRLMKTDVMGTWWIKSDIIDICDSMNLSCNFIDIKTGNYGYPYRFHFSVKSIEEKL